MRRRRLKRRLFWASLVLGVLPLALVGTVAQAAVALTRVPGRLSNRFGSTSATRRDRYEIELVG